MGPGFESQRDHVEPEQIARAFLFTTHPSGRSHRWDSNEGQAVRNGGDLARDARSKSTGVRGGRCAWMCVSAIPAGSRIDKPKHSKAHKIDFCGLFCCLLSSKKSRILKCLVSNSGAATPEENLLTRTHRRGSLSSSSVNEHLDSAKTSKEFYNHLKNHFDEQDNQDPFLSEEAKRLL
jgi:hypothetical protein